MIWVPFCIFQQRVLNLENITLGFIPKRIERKDSSRYWYTHVTTALLTRAKRWKQPKGLWTTEWMFKMQYTQTLEYS